MNDSVAGVFAGFAQTAVGHPFDSAKVLLQSQSGPLGRTQLRPAALYRGFAYPFLFNGLFSGVTFGVDDYVARRLSIDHFRSGFVSGVVGTFLTTPVDVHKIRAQRGLPRLRNPLPYRGFVATLGRESLSSALYFGTYHELQRRRRSNPMLHGGISGVLAWLCTYPLDTVKTRIQAGEVAAIRDGLKMGHLWRGIVPCLVRSFVVNACGFYAYEWCKGATT